MNELDSPNYTEFTYEKGVTRKILTYRILLITAYTLFVTVFFLVCYITRVVPLFAMCPLFLWMLIFFTWRFVSYDVYYTFDHGEMEIGKIKRRRGRMMRSAALRLDVRSLSSVVPASSAAAKELKVARHYDFSARASADELVMLMPGGGGVIAVVLEGTPRLRRLLASYAKGADISEIGG